MRNVSKSSATLGHPRGLFGMSRTNARVAVSRCAVCVVILLGTAFRAERAWADPISFQFTFRVLEARELLPGTLEQAFGDPPAKGDALRAVFTSNSEIPPDGQPEPNNGLYPLIGDWTFSWGTSTLTLGSVPTVVLVANDASGEDEHVDEAEFIGHLEGTIDFDRFDIVMDLRGPLSSLPSEAFPTAQQLQPMRGFLVLAGAPAGFQRTAFNVESLRSAPNPTPEPSSMLLFTTAALILGARQSRLRKDAD